MISSKDISYYIGGKQLYDKVSFQINPQDKIGLIGLNGTGKSTLFKMLTGRVQPDQGALHKSKACTIGYLDQDHLSYPETESIRNIALQAFVRTRALHREIEQVLHQMEVNCTDELSDKLADLQTAFGLLGGYQNEAQAEKVLEGMGFTTAALDKPISEFSGGWRMRVMLAKLLLQQPSLLLLDEPTNHLDLVAIEWLEKYLTAYPNAVLVISHDRQFLDNCTSKTLEIHQKKITTYHGNYSFYEVEKEKREAIQQKAYVNQQKSLAQGQRFIDRFKAKATKAKQVQSKIKALSRIEKIEAVNDKNPTARFQFGTTVRASRRVVGLQAITYAYDALQLFCNAHAEINRGDKIALIGANGKGKSTLLRLIAQHEQLQTGKIELGNQVKLAFYAQHQLENLNLANTVFEELRGTAPQQTEEQLRKLLGGLLFVKDDVHKKIGILSGGEKARVALAKILAIEANFLVLDEPTNHLDMLTINVLTQALQQYPGTILLVSHNRHFISQVANQIWWLENQQIKTFPADYAAYTFWQKEQGK